MNQQVNASDPVSIGRTARIISLGMTVGVFGLALVAALLDRNGMLPLDPGFETDRRVLLMVWIAIALGAVAGSLHLWRTKIEPVVHDRTVDGAPAGTPERASRLASFLIICWALVEGPALLGLVAFMVTDDWMFYWAAVVFAAIGFAVTAPRAEWFHDEGGRP